METEEKFTFKFDIKGYKAEFTVVGKTKKIALEILCGHLENITKEINQELVKTS